MRCMQYQCPVVAPFALQKATQCHIRTECQSSRQTCFPVEGHSGNFTTYLARCAGFALLRLVGDPETKDRYARGRVAQRIQLDDDSAQYNLICDLRCNLRCNLRGKRR